MIDPPQRSSLWREGWEVPKNYEDHSLNCGGFWHQWGEMDGKCGVCGDPYDSDRPNEAGGRYANGIIARTYDSADEFIEVTVEVTANVGGYFEFRLCPHNDIYKPVKQSCLDQYPLRIEGNGRRLYPDLPLGKSGFVIAKLNIPQGVTCKQCVLQWKWHGGNHWGMCTNGIGLAGCGPQTEFYNCADISILPRASSRDIKSSIKPRPDIQKQNSSSSLTNRKTPSVKTVIRQTSTASSAASTRRNVRSDVTTRIPFKTTQNTISTITRTIPEYTSRLWFASDIKTNSLATDSNATSKPIPTTNHLLSTLDSIKYHTTMIPLEAKSITTKFFSSASLSSKVVTSAQEIGEMMDNRLRYMSALSSYAHNFTSATEEKISTTLHAEISTVTTRLTSISTSMWTPTPTTTTTDQSIRTSPNTSTTTVATTTKPTTKPTTTSSTSTSTSIWTTMPTTTMADRSTKAQHRTTTTAETTMQLATTKTTTTAKPTSTITPQLSTRPKSITLQISTTIQTPITEPKPTSQPISTTPAPSTTIYPTKILTSTFDLIAAPNGSPKTSQPMTWSTFNPAQLIDKFTETPTTTTTEVSTTTAEIHPATTSFQTTWTREATLPVTIKSTTKLIDKPIVRGSAPSKREGGLSVATLFPFDLTRNLIDPSNSGINTEIKAVRRGGSNSLFNF
ncbi:hypothetical protein CHS0354_037292 [Potamilus streckersoni]|uniref:Chitin-binding type-4 domain-containing protein n=1 Tax=Potamilus streckersoni TaxID=2493646 RepID=A0AAE0W366_9BIVA|nr:hypothetical protein CHS0354_037292 [Potamilus streckersoni]